MGTTAGILPDFFELLEVAATGPHLAQYEQHLFDVLARTVGFDVAFCVRGQAYGTCTPGLDSRIREQTEPRLVDYSAEYAPLMQAAAVARGVIVDRACLGIRRLERLLTFDEVIRPHHGHSSLLLYLGPVVEPHTTVVLGRCAGGFTPQEQERLRVTRALLTVCERAVAAPAQPTRAQTASAPTLSKRERELLGYLIRGYTNKEIASACGTSYRTVRNQFSNIFKKLEASNRTEAVARCYELNLALE